MKETVSDALDWRHHFRRNPVAFSVGALSAGFLLGYGLAGALKGSGRRDGYPSAEDTDLYERTGATPTGYDEEEIQRRTAFHGHSFAAQPITDSPRAGGAEETAYERVTDEGEAGATDYGQLRAVSGSYSSPREEAQAEEEKPQKPGLLERFKETSAYDRLQTEVSSLGDRFIEELSSTAQTVVLPALFNKIKELFGVDLSNKKGGGRQQQRAAVGTAADQSGAAGGAGTGGGGGEARAASAAASSSGASSSLASASRGSSTPSYSTSENRGYGSQGDERGGTDNSVLDLDR